MDTLGGRQSLFAWLVCVFALLTPIALFAKSGDVDHGFGINGLLYRPYVANQMEGEGSAFQPDGKVIAVGMIHQAVSNDDFVVFRFNSDGSVDTSFGLNGNAQIAVTPSRDQATNVAIQSDGKIIVCGYSDNNQSVSRDFTIIRLNSDGMLDNSFGNGGIVITSISQFHDWANAVTIQPDGKIVVAGQADITGTQRFAIVRYDSDGSLDNSFDGDGIVITPGLFAAHMVTLQSDGKIVAAGELGPRFAFARYNPDGSLDTGFGDNGTVVVDVNGYGFPKAIALQPDGKIVAVGYAGGVGTLGDFATVRLNTDGSLDGSFGNGGKVVTPISDRDDIATTVVLQADGRLLIGGFTSTVNDTDFALVRYLPNGIPDGTFGNNGIAVARDPQSSERVSSLRCENGPRLFAAGFSNSGATFIKFLLNGSREFDFDSDAKSDVSVFRPLNGAWFLLRSTAGFSGMTFGLSTDKIAPVDFDGDGKTDVAVYRPGTSTWYWLNSSTETLSAVQFGAAEDLPTAADYDGDGRADVSVFRPSNGVWYRLNSSNGSFTAVQFGASEDKPTIGDYDGDGHADVAVFRPSAGAWYRLNSSNAAFVGVSFGLSSDVITPADFDGDGKTDVAVYRPSSGTWFSISSSNGALVATPFGTSEDIPTAADFDGDGRADVALFRPSNGVWYRLNSGNGSFFAVQFGANGDRPTPAAFRY
jgi:uncharacterized delta-60 repeat protein